MSNEKANLQYFQTARGLYIENPWERVKFIFKKSQHGEYHPDLVVTYQTAELGFLIGVVWGGFVHQRNFLLKLKERSDANVYRNTADAARQMSRDSLRGFLEGAWKWGPRMAIFSGGFTLFASCVEAYRNKSGIMEYTVGGSLVGVLLKLNFGLKGMLVGGLVGMVLGTVYGVTYVGMCKLTNTDKVHLKYGQYAFSQYMDELKSTRKLKQESNKLGIAVEPVSNSLNHLESIQEDEEPKNKKAEENIQEKKI